MSRATKAAAPPGPIAFDLFPLLPGTWPADGIGPVGTIIAQLPDPADLVPGEHVVVRDAGPPARGLRRVLAFARRITRKPPKAHAAARCTALLARGYRDIAAHRDPRTGQEVVWGVVPTSARSASMP